MSMTTLVHSSAGCSGTSPSSYVASWRRDSVTRMPVSLSARARTAAFRSTSGAPFVVLSLGGQREADFPQQGDQFIGGVAVARRGALERRTEITVLEPVEEVDGLAAVGRVRHDPAALRQRLHARRRDPQATVEAEDECPVAVLAPSAEGARDVRLVPVIVIHLGAVSVVRLDQPGRSLPGAARHRLHRAQHLARGPPLYQCQGVSALHHVAEERRGADPGVVVRGHQVHTAQCA